MINLILFGPPGSGKGTQSAFLIEKYNLEHLSTGNILREELANKTSLGILAQSFMDNGLLVPDDVIIGMVEKKLDEKANSVNGFIFDGFPRTIPQAQALDSLLLTKKMEINKVLSLQVSESNLINRLLQRAKIDGRADDTLETIKKRLNVYNSQTQQVAQYYLLKNKLANINGEGEIDQIKHLIAIEVDKL